MAELDLETRAARALQRIKDGHSPMRVPADPSDPDLVITALLDEVKQLRTARAELWLALDSATDCLDHFWLSWEEKSKDYRPTTDPPARAVLAWWCSGRAVDESHSTLVALVEAASENAAKLAVLESWPLQPTEWLRSWRFCEERPFDWRPGDRFPIDKGWQHERVEGRRG